jgi:hypothetical protein
LVTKASMPPALVVWKEAPLQPVGVPAAVQTGKFVEEVSPVT